MDRRGREMAFPREKPHPSHSDPQSGGFTKVRLSALRREILAPHQAAQPPDPPRGDEPPKHLALKNNKDYVQETCGHAGNGKPTPKGLTHRLTVPPNQGRTSRLKSSWTTGEGDAITKL